MEAIYDLHRHTHLLVVEMGDNEVDMYLINTVLRKSQFSDILSKKVYTQKSSITYDSQKSNILSWGRETVIEDEDVIHIDKFKEKLYLMFQKGKDDWDEDDVFLLKAISDFMYLSVKKTIEESDYKIKDHGALHIVFITPSTWDEDIRELIIRPIFIQSNLISKDDHSDRLLFCSDIESLFYYLTDKLQYRFSFDMPKDVILGRITATNENQVQIKLDLVLAVNHLFDFSNSLVFPKILNTNFLYISSDDIKNGIIQFMKNEVPFPLKEDTIRYIMSAIRDDFFNTLNMDNLYALLNKPFITELKVTSGNSDQQQFIKSITPFRICAEISKHLYNNRKDLIPSNNKKEYVSLISIVSSSSRKKLDKGLLNWSKCIILYNHLELGSKNKSHKCIMNDEGSFGTFLEGASQYALNAIQNSDMYCKPRILPTGYEASRSSIFLNSKPDAIMNIDITHSSTLLSFSILDENGTIKKIWHHDNFITDTCLGSLGSFFSFSETTTLNVNSSFITFVEKYSTDNRLSVINDKNATLHKFIARGKKYWRDSKGYRINNRIMAKMKDIVCRKSDKDDSLVSIRKNIYIKMFLQIYMTYISEVVLSKMDIIVKPYGQINIGYAVTIESRLLWELFGTEDMFRDIIYNSGLLCKYDDFKKLRVITQGEGLFSVIQHSLQLQFPLKSFFVLAQLHEDYIQLTVNQVITEYIPNKEDQESIPLQNEILDIPNIYESLCFHIWNNIVQDNSFIKLCSAHIKCNDVELLDIFSSDNQMVFMNNFKQFISKKILAKKSKIQFTDKITLPLGVSCNCGVSLTANDIVEISFRPVLRNITSIVSTSLTNKQFFGNYENIHSLFYLTSFNYNSQFQPLLMKLIEDEIDQFMYESGINVPHYIIPDVSSRFLQYVLYGRHFSYRGFQEGVLRQVYSENYAFATSKPYKEEVYTYKNERSDKEGILIQAKTLFLLFKKGDKISNNKTSRSFYLSSRLNKIYNTSLTYYKLKDINNLSFDKTFRLEDTLEITNGPDVSDRDLRSYKGLPVIIYISYKGHSSSLCLTAKLIGEERTRTQSTIFAEPMTLARF